MSTEDGEKLAPVPARRRTLPSGLVWSLAYLFVLSFVLVAADLLVLAHEIHRVNETVAVNHAQRCSGLTSVARIRMLAGANAANPSRVAINTIIESDRRRAASLHCAAKGVPVGH